MLQRLFTLIIVTLLLTSCGEPEVDWFEYQYADGSPFDALTECGPTVASNALCWAGICKGRETARAYYKQPSWWWLFHIKNYIVASGGSAQLKPFSLNNVAAYLNDNMLIFRVRHIVPGTHHMIAVLKKGEVLTVYDPLSGIRTTTLTELATAVSDNQFVLVARD